MQINLISIISIKGIKVKYYIKKECTMGKREKTRPIYINCNKCEKGDKPTVWANNGWRITYTIVCWVWLGVGITVGNAFFIALGMFTLPLLVDYLSFTTSDTFRKGIKWAQVVGCIFFCSIAILGIMDCLTIAKIGNNLAVQSTNKYILLQNTNVSLVLLYRVSAILILFTVIDVTTKTKEIECILEESIKISA